MNSQFFLTMHVFCIIQNGIMKAGCKVLLCTPGLTAQELTTQLEDCEVTIVVTHSLLFDIYLEARKLMSNGESTKVIVVDNFNW